MSTRINSLQGHTLTRTEAEPSTLASQSPEQLHEGWNEASEKENSQNTHTCPLLPDAWLAQHVIHLTLDEMIISINMHTLEMWKNL